MAIYLGETRVLINIDLISVTEGIKLISSEGYYLQDSEEKNLTITQGG